jgi:molybdenum cofactor cytidylyltransferase
MSPKFKVQSPKSKVQSPKTQDQIAAILLAAGRSRRMGAFKPLLPFGRKTVVEACVNNLRAADIQDIVIVLGHRAGDVRNALKEHQVRFAFNDDPESEMSVSIARGVEQIDSDTKAVIIALVDQPAVPREIVEILIREWRHNDVKLVQPEYQTRGGHPILIDMAYRQELLSLDPERGLRSLFDKHRNDVRRLPVETPYVARDMDTWEDYRRLHEEIFGRPPAA